MSLQVPATLDALRVPTASLRPYERNPRRGDLEALKRSLEHHGQYRPIVVNRRTDEVLAGNHTLAAAIALGWEEIAATYVDVDDEQAARIVLVDNRTNDLAGYDDQALADILRELDGDLAGTGFAADDLDRLLARLDSDETSGDTEPGEPPAEPITAPGDRIALGDHVLLCGDCRDGARVLALGVEAEMVWTDPPYGVALGDVTALRSGTDYGDMTGDELDPAATRDLVRDALAVANELTAPGGAIYVCHAETNGLPFREAMAAAGWGHKQTLIWVKQQLVLGRQDYQWKHEPILYGWKPGAAHRFHAAFDQTTVLEEDVDLRKMNRAQLLEAIKGYRAAERSTVLEEDRPHRADLHPTSKPIALCERLIRNSCRVGETVYDPFGGSGSTLIACENLQRRAALVEISPGYCDVIVDRWQRHTGREAQRA